MALILDIFSHLSQACGLMLSEQQILGFIFTIRTDYMCVNELQPIASDSMKIIS